MYLLSLGLFAVAAVAGLTMAIMHFRGTSPPKTVLAVLHGLFAASGLVVLLLALIKTGFSGTPGIAFGLLGWRRSADSCCSARMHRESACLRGWSWVMLCWQLPAS